MANSLTAVRLLLAAPVAGAFARPELVNPTFLLVLLCVAIGTDYYDGRVARRMGVSSPAGQLFDHSTDCVFVSAGLTGLAIVGPIPAVLPALVIVAFVQYVMDSYWWHQEKQLRMSVIGRWNGILYFAPLMIIAASRLGVFGATERFLVVTAEIVGYVLVVSTIVSIADRAVAPRMARHR